MTRKTTRTTTTRRTTTITADKKEDLRQEHGPQMSLVSGRKMAQIASLRKKATTKYNQTGCPKLWFNGARTKGRKKTQLK